MYLQFFSCILSHSKPYLIRHNINQLPKEIVLQFITKSFFALLILLIEWQNKLTMCNVQNAMFIFVQQVCLSQLILYRILCQCEGHHIKKCTFCSLSQGNLIGAGKEGSRFFFKSVNIWDRKMFFTSFVSLWL